MSIINLCDYARKKIAVLNLGDSDTNCHGIVVQPAENGVRLIDGIGLNVVCTTNDEIDGELELMANWYAEHNN